MARKSGGNTVPDITQAEHDDLFGVPLKKVGNYTFNTDTEQWERWDGEISIGEVSLEGVGVFNDFEQATAGITQADTTITLSQEVESFDIQNTGDNIVYVNFDAAATTNHIAIDPGMTMSRSLKVTAIHGICDTGLTSTLRVVGYY
jgi:hypothetical protein